MTTFKSIKTFSNLLNYVSDTCDILYRQIQQIKENF